MYTCGIRINAKLVKEGSFRINAKLVKEELNNSHQPGENVFIYDCVYLLNDA